MAQRSILKRAWYELLHAVCRNLGVGLFRIRSRGHQHVPRRGPALILSNHQSHFDPVLVGLCCSRRLNYLARATLFGFAPFRWLIQSLDAIPIDREGLGLAGIKQTLQRLRNDELVLIFPEGTRTHDGQIAPLKSGFCALARRAKVPLVPVAIDGAFDAWPRTRKFPRVATIHVVFGQPLQPADIEALADDQHLIAEIERRMRACHAQAQAGARRARRGW